MRADEAEAGRIGGTSLRARGSSEASLSQATRALSGVHSTGSLAMLPLRISRSPLLVVVVLDLLLQLLEPATEAESAREFPLLCSPQQWDA